MYATEGKYDSTSDAKMMAIFDSQSGTLTKVTDFPVAEELADMGRFVYVEMVKPIFRSYSRNLLRVHLQFNNPPFILLMLRLLRLLRERLFRLTEVLPLFVK